MQRFDVVKNTNPTNQKHFPLLMVVQSDFLSHLSTCLVIPMVLERQMEEGVMRVLNPIFEIGGKRHVMNTQLMTGMRKQWLGSVVTNLEHQRTDIVRAIDFLISGF